jgi:serpin B
MPLKRSFYEVVTEHYLADIFKLTTVEAINSWVNEKTMGKIPTILQSVPGSTALVLVNAIYFKGIWLDEFDKSKTQNQYFISPSGQQSVPFMNIEKEYQYKKGLKYEAVRMPYRDTTTALYVFLPDTSSSLSEFYAKTLSDSSDGGYYSFDYNLYDWKWQDDPNEELFSQFSNAEVTLSLPAYTFEFESSLKDYLCTMGMESIFHSDRSDFSNFAIGKDPWVFDVIHKTYVEVNEEGTEAAAATAVVMIDSAAISIRVTLNINRPFFFCIRDDKTGAILFMGQVTKP